MTDKTEKKFQINFFELMFLAEACIPPRPIARAVFWDDIIDKYYHLMTNEERKHLYDFMNRNMCFINSIANDDEQCLIFNARFNPLNQYSVYAKHPSGKEQWMSTFLYKEKYHTEIDRWVPNEYIIDILPIYES